MRYKLETFTDITVAQQFQKDFKKSSGYTPELFMYSENEIKVVVPNKVK